MMKEIIERIINDESLSREDKSTIIERVDYASHGINKFITPGLYLRSELNENSNEIDMQLWYRNVDESGMINHGPTNYDSDQITELMKIECLKKDEKVR